MAPTKVKDGKSKKTGSNEEKAKSWTRIETLALLNAWKEKNIQHQLRGKSPFVKGIAWKSIKEEMEKSIASTRTVGQIKDKMKRLRSKYDEEAAARHGTGTQGGDPEFEYWEMMHEVLQSHHSSNPANPMDTGVGDQEESEKEEDHGEEDESTDQVADNGDEQADTISNDDGLLSPPVSQGM